MDNADRNNLERVAYCNAKKQAICILQVVVVYQRYNCGLLVCNRDKHTQGIIKLYDVAANQTIKVLEDITITSWNEVAQLEPSLTISPNPAHDKVQLTFENIQLEPKASLSIFNSLGQLVWQSQISNIHSNKMSLNVADLEDGLYLVALKSGNQVLNNKLIIH